MITNITGPGGTPQTDGNGGFWDKVVDTKNNITPDHHQNAAPTASDKAAETLGRTLRNVELGLNALGDLLHPKPDSKN